MNMKSSTLYLGSTINLDCAESDGTELHLANQQ